MPVIRGDCCVDLHQLSIGPRVVNFRLDWHMDDARSYGRVHLRLPILPSKDSNVRMQRRGRDEDQKLQSMIRVLSQDPTTHDQKIACQFSFVEYLLRSAQPYLHLLLLDGKGQHSLVEPFSNQEEQASAGLLLGR